MRGRRNGLADACSLVHNLTLGRSAARLDKLRRDVASLVRLRMAGDSVLCATALEQWSGGAWWCSALLESSGTPAYPRPPTVADRLGSTIVSCATRRLVENIVGE